MPILSQASQGLSCEEGATTTRMSPNNNSLQERPNFQYNVVSLPTKVVDMNCKNCGPKPDTEFYLKDGKPAGSYCKNCISERNKTLYKETNRDRVKAWRAANPEEYKAQVQRSKAVQKKRMQEDKEYGDLVRSKKMENARKNYAGTILGRARLRAQKLGIPFDLVKEDIKVPDICPLLGITLEFGTKENYMFTPSLDRIEPSKGYVKSNVRVISMLANTMKSNASKEQLLKFAKNIGPYLKV